MPAMQSTEVLALLAEGAGPTLQPLAEPVAARELAAHLIAFANADGGTVVIGTDHSGAVAGLRSAERAHDAALRAYLLCSPPLMLHLPEQVVVRQH